MRLLILLLTIISILWASPGITKYQPWDEKVFIHVQETYGPRAEKRMRFLHNMIIENQDLGVDEKLKLVNTTMNKLPWIADARLWKQSDYWASPLETITTFGGDCEDIAIVKWVVLNHMGISAKHLRLAVVKIKRSSERHMVLLYLPDPDLSLEKQTPLVLDNYVKEIKPGNERRDLLSIYLMDAQGTLVLVADDGKKREIKGEYKGRKHKKLDDLKKKIAESRSFYKELNNGRPLLPENI